MQHAITILEVLGVLAVLLVAGAVATRGGGVLAEAPPDDPDLDLPAGQLQPEDIRRVRFGMVARGYRMREVDQVLAQVAAELAARDARLLALEQALVDVVEPQREQAEQHLTAPAEELSNERVEEWAPTSTPEPDPAPAEDPNPVGMITAWGATPPSEAASAVSVSLEKPPRTPLDPTSLVPRPVTPAEPVEPPADREPESLPSLANEFEQPPLEPTAELLAGQPPPVEHAAVSDPTLRDVDDDNFPEVHRADDEP